MAPTESRVNDRLSRLDAIPDCDRQMDEQTTFDSKY